MRRPENIRSSRDFRGSRRRLHTPDGIRTKHAGCRIRGRVPSRAVLGATGATTFAKNEHIMQYEPISARPPSEVHRYFPEWADRPASTGPLLESDHNSYLAGGYSEEFGYRVRPDRPPVFPLLSGDPDRSREWAVQIGALHPGYPECPRPADRSGARPMGIANVPDMMRTADADSPDRRTSITRVIRVARRGAERRFALISTPLSALWARLRIRGHIRDRGL